MCVQTGAPALRDRNMPGGGFHPGPRGSSGEPGPGPWDARCSGGAQFWVRFINTLFFCSFLIVLYLTAPCNCITKLFIFALVFLLQGFPDLRRTR